MSKTFKLVVSAVVAGALSHAQYAYVKGYQQAMKDVEKMDRHVDRRLRRSRT